MSCQFVDVQHIFLKPVFQALQLILSRRNFFDWISSGILVAAAAGAAAPEVIAGNCAGLSGIRCRRTALHHMSKLQQENQKKNKIGET